MLLDRHRRENDTASVQLPFMLRHRIFKVSTYTSKCCWYHIGNASVEVNFIQRFPLGLWSLYDQFFVMVERQLVA